MQRVASVHETPDSPADRLTRMIRHRTPFQDSARTPEVSALPTAMQAVEVTQDTLLKTAVGVTGSGVASDVQVLPSQVCASGAVIEAGLLPAATQCVFVVQEMADGLPAGAGSKVHEVPFHDSASDFGLPGPTATQRVADAQETLSSIESELDSAGVLSIRQELPFQASASGEKLFVLGS
jgi:hypothetical protein